MANYGEPPPRTTCQALRHLRGGETFDLRQHEHAAVVFRHCVESREQAFHGLLLGEQALGVRLSADSGPRGLLADRNGISWPARRSRFW